MTTQQYADKMLALWRTRRKDYQHMAIDLKLPAESCRVITDYVFYRDARLLAQNFELWGGEHETDVPPSPSA